MPVKKLIAVITDIKNPESSVPVFNLDDVNGVADFITNKYLKR